MRVLRLVAIFLTVSCLGFVSKAVAQPAASSSGETDDSQAVADVQVVDVPPDQLIERRLKRILRATEWFKDLQVEVQDGVVFLDGVADLPARQEWAAELAGKTDGVAAVVNRLKVNKEFNLTKTTQIVLSSLKTLWQDFLAHSPFILAGLLAVALTALAARLAQAIASRLATRSRLRTSIQDLILQLLTIAIWAVGLLVAAVIMFPGMTPARAITVLGLGSVAVGFAFKDIFENFFAGILILWKYPFDKGDFIECGAIQGRIEDITIRMTMIRQVDGQLVVAPNALLFKNAVDVLTNQPIRRATIICGVSYDTDLAAACQVIKEAVASCASVRQANPVEIFAREFADSSINFEVTWWTGATPLEVRESRNEVVQGVKAALDSAGIEIPFPQRTLWLPEPVQTIDGSAGANNSADDTSPT